MPTLKILHNQSSSRPFFALVQNYEDIIFLTKRNHHVRSLYGILHNYLFLTLNRFVLYADLFTIAKLK